MTSDFHTRDIPALKTHLWSITEQDLSPSSSAEFDFHVEFAFLVVTDETRFREVFILLCRNDFVDNGTLIAAMHNSLTWGKDARAVAPPLRVKYGRDGYGKVVAMLFNTLRCFFAGFAGAGRYLYSGSNTGIGRAKHTLLRAIPVDDAEDRACLWL